MTLDSEKSVSLLLDPFAYTKQDNIKIKDFNFPNEEKVRIKEAYCTLVTVGGKYLEKNTFKKVLKKVDDIRKIIRKKKL